MGRGGRESSSQVVYFGGIVKAGSFRRFAWYRVDVDSLFHNNDDVVESKTNRSKKKGLFVKPSPHKRRSMALEKEKLKIKRKKKQIPRVNLDIAAEMTVGYMGCCTMIGDHIYWFGENRRTDNTMDLFKHDINVTAPWAWDPLSSTTDLFSRATPVVVVPVGKKLYVLRGTGTGLPKDEARDKSNFCGAIYDLDSGTWETLKCSISTPAGSYYAPYVALTGNYDCEPKGILFYSLREGSVLFLDLTSGEWHHDQSHYSLALWNPIDIPLGLEDCSCSALVNATKYGPAILREGTLYWFTSDLQLFGYEFHLRRWIRSPFLGKQFPSLEPFDPYNKDALFPFLVDLHNGKFMLLVSEGLGEFTVALLSVFIDEQVSLSVTVESVRALTVDSTFTPLAELATLKNTQSGHMPGSVKSAMGTQWRLGEMVAREASG